MIKKSYFINGERYPKEEYNKLMLLGECSSGRACKKSVLKLLGMSGNMKEAANSNKVQQVKNRRTQNLISNPSF